MIRRAELDLLKKLERWVESESREEMREEIERAIKAVDECYRIVRDYPVPEDFYWSQVNMLSPATQAKIGILLECFQLWKEGKLKDPKKFFAEKFEEWKREQEEIEKMLMEEWGD